MKVLYLTPYSPVPPVFGGAIRIYHVLKQLVVRHEVTVAGFGDPTECEQIKQAFPELNDRIYCLDQPFRKSYRKLVLMYSMLSHHSYWYNMIWQGNMQRLLDEILDHQEFDFIQSEFPILSHYRFNTDAIKIVDAHNVEYDNFRRMAEKAENWWKKLYFSQESKKFRVEELQTIASQDALFVTSKRDADIYNRDIASVPKYEIPNGVDVNYFRPWEAPRESTSLVFVGTMQYPPNIDAMKYFLDQIFPQIRKRVPNVKIYIVGGKPTSEILAYRSSNVIVTEFVPDVRPYINRSTVYVVPLRMGGGTRLKILEAMAMRIPIVTTSIGCEGINLTHQETAIIADSARNFTESVVELLSNVTLRKQLSDCAYDLVHNNYSWSIIGEQMEQAYQQIHRKKKDPTTNNHHILNDNMELSCKT